MLRLLHMLQYPIQYELYQMINSVQRGNRILLTRLIREILVHGAVCLNDDGRGGYLDRSVTP